MKAYQLNNAFTASLKKAEKVKEMIDSEKWWVIKYLILIRI
jgi:hypothetical protein